MRVTVARPSERHCPEPGRVRVIAILGKGHELGQEVAGEVFPFSDAEVAAAEWAARVE